MLLVMFSVSVNDKRSVQKGRQPASPTRLFLCFLMLKSDDVMLYGCGGG